MKGSTMSRYADYHDLKIEVANKVATVTLNRPEARNAINQRLIRELRTIWDDLGDDLDVNAVLLTGAGDRFSVGGDVKAMSDRPGGDVLEEGEVHDPMISRRLVNRLPEDRYLLREEAEDRGDPVEQRRAIDAAPRRHPDEPGKTGSRVTPETAPALAAFPAQHLRRPAHVNPEERINVLLRHDRIENQPADPAGESPRVPLGDIGPV